jgi:hypothetical protein
MKALYGLVIAGVLLTALGAGIQDYLAEMKTSIDAVERFVQDDFAYGNFSYPSACARIPQTKRAAIVRAAGEFARSFTASKSFIDWYDGLREQRKPAPPESTPSMADSRAQQVEALKKQIVESEKSAASAPAEQRAIFNDVLKALRSSLKEIEKTDNSQDALMDNEIAKMNAAAKQEYAQKLAAFEAEYPKGNPRPLIKLRLQALLKETEGVDFTAKLAKKNNQMVFANPEYEKKNRDWKLAFRAGKEATEAARAFAREWLKSL